MLLEIRSRLGLIPLVLHYGSSMYVCTPPSSPAVAPEKSANDEVERRGASPTPNEATLSQSSTYSLAHRRRDPRSLEPIVRRHFATTHPTPRVAEETRPTAVTIATAMNITRSAPLDGNNARRPRSLGFPGRKTMHATAIAAGPSNSLHHAMRPALPNSLNARAKPITTRMTNAPKSPSSAGIVAANDEVERRGASPASNEGNLSQSSTPSLAQRRCDPAIARTDC